MSVVSDVALLMSRVLRFDILVTVKVLNLLLPQYIVPILDGKLLRPVSWLLLQFSVVIDEQSLILRLVRALLLQLSEVSVVVEERSSVFNLLNPVMLSVVNGFWAQLNVSIEEGRLGSEVNLLLLIFNSFIAEQPVMLRFVNALPEQLSLVSGALFLTLSVANLANWLIVNSVNLLPEQSIVVNAEQLATANDVRPFDEQLSDVSEVQFIRLRVFNCDLPVMVSEVKLLLGASNTVNELGIVGNCESLLLPQLSIESELGSEDIDVILFEEQYNSVSPLGNDDNVVRLL